MEATSTNTTIIPISVNKHILDSVLYEPRLIINIVSYVGIDSNTTILTSTKVEYLGIYTLLVCKKWTTILYGAIVIRDNHLREAVVRALPPAIPAAYYDLMSLKQKVTLGNHLIEKAAMTASLKPQYRMKWDVVIDHCRSDPLFARWILGAWKCMEVCQYNLSECVTVLFKYFESYRSHICTLNDSYGVPPRIMCGGFMVTSNGKYMYQYHSIYGSILTEDIYFVFSSENQYKKILDDARTILDAAGSIVPVTHPEHNTQVYSL